jgi:hypothetical protein
MKERKNEKERKKRNKFLAKKWHWNSRILDPRLQGEKKLHF